MKASQTFASLELSRGIAALLVVMFHYHFYVNEYFKTNPIVARIFEGGHAGVEFFFVLSGFIMFITHRHDGGKPLAAFTFLQKRAIRILPMYWIVITVSLVAFLSHPGWGGSKGISVHNVIFDYLLLPTQGALILAPAWTLKCEALFYAFFCVALFRPAVGIAAFVSWQTAIILANAVGLITNSTSDNDYVNYILDIHNIGFGLGVLCGWASVELRLASPVREFSIFAIGVISVVCIMAFESVENANYVDLQPIWEKIILSFSYSLMFSLVIFSVVRLEQIYKPKFDRRLLVFGASSYTLYLIHDPVASLLAKAAVMMKLPSLTNENVAYLIGVAVAIAVAIAVHLHIERPLTDRLKQLVRARSVQLKTAQKSG